MHKRAHNIIINKPQIYCLQIKEDGNETALISLLTFVPVPEDDGSVLKCIGENSKMMSASLEDNFKLNVVCK